MNKHDDADDKTRANGGANGSAPEEEVAVESVGGEEAQLEAEVAALKDQALRYAAEAENTRRRAEREVNDARAYAIQKFARDLLGVADNLARALQHAPKSDEDPLARNLAIGLEMTQKELLAAFERNGLKRVAPAPGERFDPHKHQAMSEQTSAEVAPGTVVALMQDGFELFGRLVRPAMVVVAGRDSTGAAASAHEAPTEAPR
ncbi:MAG TPA: nucleotide exchange factor GrpE [Caulobacteraceae bacterium]|jgi:molecular chaperone GrpE|nr:nucleotide exchange factor GrpE [Caulobacteraceae bacterium]